MSIFPLAPFSSHDAPFNGNIHAVLATEVSNPSPHLIRLLSTSHYIQPHQVDTTVPILHDLPLLFSACYYQHMDVFLWCLENGADLNHVDPLTSATPLSMLFSSPLGPSEAMYDIFNVMLNQPDFLHLDLKTNEDLFAIEYLFLPVLIKTQYNSEISSLSPTNSTSATPSLTKPATGVNYQFQSLFRFNDWTVKILQLYLSELSLRFSSRTLFAHQIYQSNLNQLKPHPLSSTITISPPNSSPPCDAPIHDLLYLQHIIAAIFQRVITANPAIAISHLTHTPQNIIDFHAQPAYPHELSKFPVLATSYAARANAALPLTTLRHGLLEPVSRLDKSPNTSFFEFNPQLDRPAEDSMAIDTEQGEGTTVNDEIDAVFDSLQPLITSNWATYHTILSALLNHTVNTSHCDIQPNQPPLDDILTTFQRLDPVDTVKVLPYDYVDAAGNTLAHHFFKQAQPSYSFFLKLLAAQVDFTMPNNADQTPLHLLLYNTQPYTINTIHIVQHILAQLQLKLQQVSFFLKRPLDLLETEPPDVNNTTGNLPALNSPIHQSDSPTQPAPRPPRFNNENSTYLSYGTNVNPTTYQKNSRIQYYLTLFHHDILNSTTPLPPQNKITGFGDGREAHPQPTPNQTAKANQDSNPPIDINPINFLKDRFGYSLFHYMALNEGGQTPVQDEIYTTLIHFLHDVASTFRPDPSDEQETAHPIDPSSNTSQHTTESRQLSSALSPLLHSLLFSPSPSPHLLTQLNVKRFWTDTQILKTALISLLDSTSNRPNNFAQLFVHLLSMYLHHRAPPSQSSPPQTPSQAESTSRKKKGKKLCKKRFTSPDILAMTRLVKEQSGAPNHTSQPTPHPTQLAQPAQPSLPIFNPSKPLTQAHISTLVNILSKSNADSALIFQLLLANPSINTNIPILSPFIPFISQTLDTLHINKPTLLASWLQSINLNTSEPVVQIPNLIWADSSLVAFDRSKNNGSPIPAGMEDFSTFKQIHLARLNLGGLLQTIRQSLFINSTLLNTYHHTLASHSTAHLDLILPDKLLQYNSLFPTTSHTPNSTPSPHPQTFSHSNPMTMNDSIFPFGLSGPLLPFGPVTPLSSKGVQKNVSRVNSVGRSEESDPIHRFATIWTLFTQFSDLLQQQHHHLSLSTTASACSSANGQSCGKCIDVINLTKPHCNLLCICDLIERQSNWAITRALGETSSILGGVLTNPSICTPSGYLLVTSILHHSHKIFHNYASMQYAYQLYTLRQSEQNDPSTRNDSLKRLKRLARQDTRTFALRIVCANLKLFLSNSAVIAFDSYSCSHSLPSLRHQSDRDYSLSKSFYINLIFWSILLSLPELQRGMNVSPTARKAKAPKLSKPQFPKPPKSGVIMPCTTTLPVSQKYLTRALHLLQARISKQLLHKSSNTQNLLVSLINAPFATSEEVDISTPRSDQMTPQTPQATLLSTIDSMNRSLSRQISEGGVVLVDQSGRPISTPINPQTPRKVPNTNTIIGQFIHLLLIHSSNSRVDAVKFNFDCLGIDSEGQGVFSTPHFNHLPFDHNPHNQAFLLKQVNNRGPQPALPHQPPGKALPPQPTVAITPHSRIPTNMYYLAQFSIKHYFWDNYVALYIQDCALLSSILAITNLSEYILVYFVYLDVCKQIGEIERQFGLVQSTSHLEFSQFEATVGQSDSTQHITSRVTNPFSTVQQHHVNSTPQSNNSQNVNPTSPPLYHHLLLEKLHLERDQLLHKLLTDEKCCFRRDILTLALAAPMQFQGLLRLGFLHFISSEIKTDSLPNHIITDTIANLSGPQQHRGSQNSTLPFPPLTIHTFSTMHASHNTRIHLTFPQKPAYSPTFALHTISPASTTINHPLISLRRRSHRSPLPSYFLSIPLATQDHLLFPTRKSIDRATTTWFSREYYVTDFYQLPAPQDRAVPNTPCSPQLLEFLDQCHPTLNSDLRRIYYEASPPHIYYPNLFIFNKDRAYYAGKYWKSLETTPLLRQNNLHAYLTYQNAVHELRSIGNKNASAIFDYNIHPALLSQPVDSSQLFSHLQILTLHQKIALLRLEHAWMSALLMTNQQLTNYALRLLDQLGICVIEGGGKMALAFRDPTPSTTVSLDQQDSDLDGFMNTSQKPYYSLTEDGVGERQSNTQYVYTQHSVKYNQNSLNSANYAVSNHNLGRAPPSHLSEQAISSQGLVKSFEQYYFELNQQQHHIKRDKSRSKKNRTPSSPSAVKHNATELNIGSKDFPQHSAFYHQDTPELYLRLQIFLREVTLYKAQCFEALESWFTDLTECIFTAKRVSLDLEFLRAFEIFYKKLYQEPHVQIHPTIFEQREPELSPEESGGSEPDEPSPSSTHQHADTESPMGEPRNLAPTMAQTYEVVCVDDGNYNLDDVMPRRVTRKINKSNITKDFSLTNDIPDHESDEIEVTEALLDTIDAVSDSFTILNPSLDPMLSIAPSVAFRRQKTGTSRTGAEVVQEAEPGPQSDSPTSFFTDSASVTGSANNSTARSSDDETPLPLDQPTLLFQTCKRLLCQLQFDYDWTDGDILTPHGSRILAQEEQPPSVLSSEELQSFINDELLGNFRAMRTPLFNLYLGLVGGHNLHRKTVYECRQVLKRYELERYYAEIQVENEDIFEQARARGIVDDLELQALLPKRKQHVVEIPDPPFKYEIPPFPWHFLLTPSHSDHFNHLSNPPSHNTLSLYEESKPLLGFYAYSLHILQQNLFADHLQNETIFPSTKTSEMTQSLNTHHQNALLDAFAMPSMGCIFGLAPNPSMMTKSLSTLQDHITYAKEQAGKDHQTMHGGEHASNDGPNAVTKPYEFVPKIGEKITHDEWFFVKQTFQRSFDNVPMFIREVIPQTSSQLKGGGEALTYATGQSIPNPNQPVKPTSLSSSLDIRQDSILPGKLQSRIDRANQADTFEQQMSYVLKTSSQILGGHPFDTSIAEYLYFRLIKLLLAELDYDDFQQSAVNTQLDDLIDRLQSYRVSTGFENSLLHHIPPIQPAPALHPSFSHIGTMTPLSSSRGDGTVDHRPPNMDGHQHSLSMTAVSSVLHDGYSNPRNNDTTTTFPVQNSTSLSYLPSAGFRSTQLMSKYKSIFKPKHQSTIQTLLDRYYHNRSLFPSSLSSLHYFGFNYRILSYANQGNLAVIRQSKNRTHSNQSESAVGPLMVDLDLIPGLEQFVTRSAVPPSTNPSRSEVFPGLEIQDKLRSTEPTPQEAQYDTVLDSRLNYPPAFFLETDNPYLIAIRGVMVHFINFHHGETPPNSTTSDSKSEKHRKHSGRSYIKNPLWMSLTMFRMIETAQIMGQRNYPKPTSTDQRSYNQPFAPPPKPIPPQNAQMTTTPSNNPKTSSLSASVDAAPGKARHSTADQNDASQPHVISFPPDPDAQKHVRALLKSYPVIIALLRTDTGLVQKLGRLVEHNELDKEILASILTTNPLLGRAISWGKITVPMVQELFRLFTSDDNWAEYERVVAEEDAAAAARKARSGFFGGFWSWFGYSQDDADKPVETEAAQTDPTPSGLSADTRAIIDKFPALGTLLQSSPVVVGKLAKLVVKDDTSPSGFHRNQSILNALTQSNPILAQFIESGHLSSAQIYEIAQAYRSEDSPESTPSSSDTDGATASGGTSEPWKDSDNEHHISPLGADSNPFGGLAAIIAASPGLSSIFPHLINQLQTGVVNAHKLTTYLKFPPLHTRYEYFSEIYIDTQHLASSFTTLTNEITTTLIKQSADLFEDPPIHDTPDLSTADPLRNFPLLKAVSTAHRVPNIFDTPLDFLIDLARKNDPTTPFIPTDSMFDYLFQQDDNVSSEPTTSADHADSASSEAASDSPAALKFSRQQRQVGDLFEDFLVDLLLPFYPDQAEAFTQQLYLRSIKLDAEEEVEVLQLEEQLKSKRDGQNGEDVELCPPTQQPIVSSSKRSTDHISQTSLAFNGSIFFGPSFLINSLNQQEGNAQNEPVCTMPNSYTPLACSQQGRTQNITHDGVTNHRHTKCLEEVGSLFSPSHPLSQELPTDLIDRWYTYHAFIMHGQTTLEDLSVYSNTSRFQRQLENLTKHHQFQVPLYSLAPQSLIHNSSPILPNPVPPSLSALLSSPVPPQVLDNYIINPQITAPQQSLLFAQFLTSSINLHRQYSLSLTPSLPSRIISDSLKHDYILNEAEMKSFSPTFTRSAVAKYLPQSTNLHHDLLRVLSIETSDPCNAYELQNQFNPTHPVEFSDPESNPLNHLTSVLSLRSGSNARPMVPTPGQPEHSYLMIPETRDETVLHQRCLPHELFVGSYDGIRSVNYGFIGNSFQTGDLVQELQHLDPLDPQTHLLKLSYRNYESFVHKLYGIGSLSQIDESVDQSKPNPTSTQPIASSTQWTGLPISIQFDQQFQEILERLSQVGQVSQFTALVSKTSAAIHGANLRGDNLSSHNGPNLTPTGQFGDSWPIYYESAIEVMMKRALERRVALQQKERLKSRRKKIDQLKRKYSHQGDATPSDGSDTAALAVPSAYDSVQVRNAQYNQFIKSIFSPRYADLCTTVYLEDENSIVTPTTPIQQLFPWLLSSFNDNAVIRNSIQQSRLHPVQPDEVDHDGEASSIKAIFSPPHPTIPQFLTSFLNMRSELMSVSRESVASAENGQAGKSEARNPSFERNPNSLFQRRQLPTGSAKQPNEMGETTPHLNDVFDESSDPSIPYLKLTPKQQKSAESALDLQDKLFSIYLSLESGSALGLNHSNDLLHVFGLQHNSTAQMFTPPPLTALQQSLDLSIMRAVGMVYKQIVHFFIFEVSNISFSSSFDPFGNFPVIRPHHINRSVLEYLTAQKGAGNRSAELSSKKQKTKPIFPSGTPHTSFYPFPHHPQQLRNILAIQRLQDYQHKLTAILLRSQREFSKSYSTFALDLFIRVRCIVAEQLRAQCRGFQDKFMEIPDNFEAPKTSKKRSDLPCAADPTDPPHTPPATIHDNTQKHLLFLALLNVVLKFLHRAFQTAPNVLYKLKYASYNAPLDGASHMSSSMEPSSSISSELPRDNTNTPLPSFRSAILLSDQQSPCPSSESDQISTVRTVPVDHSAVDFAERALKLTETVGKDNEDGKSAPPAKSQVVSNQLSPQTNSIASGSTKVKSSEMPKSFQPPNHPSQTQTASNNTPSTTTASKNQFDPTLPILPIPVSVFFDLFHLLFSPGLISPPFVSESFCDILSAEAISSLISECRAEVEVLLCPQTPPCIDSPSSLNDGLSDRDHGHFQFFIQFLKQNSHIIDVLFQPPTSTQPALSSLQTHINEDNVLEFFQQYTTHLDFLTRNVSHECDITFDVDGISESNRDIESNCSADTIQAAPTTFGVYRAYPFILFPLFPPPQDPQQTHPSDRKSGPEFFSHRSKQIYHSLTTVYHHMKCQQVNDMKTFPDDEPSHSFNIHNYRKPLFDPVPAHLFGHDHILDRHQHPGLHPAPPLRPEWVNVVFKRFPRDMTSQPLYSNINSDLRSQFQQYFSSTVSREARIMTPKPRSALAPIAKSITPLHTALISHLETTLHTFFLTTQSPPEQLGHPFTWHSQQQSVGLDQSLQIDMTLLNALTQQISRTISEHIALSRFGNPDPTSTSITSLFATTHAILHQFTQQRKTLEAALQGKEFEAASETNPPLTQFKLKSSKHRKPPRCSTRSSQLSSKRKVLSRKLRELRARKKIGRSRSNFVSHFLSHNTPTATRRVAQTAPLYTPNPLAPAITTPISRTQHPLLDQISILLGQLPQHGMYLIEQVYTIVDIFFAQHSDPKSRLNIFTKPPSRQSSDLTSHDTKQKIFVKCSSSQHLTGLQNRGDVLLRYNPFFFVGYRPFVLHHHLSSVRCRTQCAEMLNLPKGQSRHPQNSVSGESESFPRTSAECALVLPKPLPLSQSLHFQYLLSAHRLAQLLSTYTSVHSIRQHRVPIDVLRSNPRTQQHGPHLPSKPPTVSSIIPIDADFRGQQLYVQQQPPSSGSSSSESQIAPLGNILDLPVENVPDANYHLEVTPSPIRSFDFQYELTQCLYELYKLSSKMIQMSAEKRRTCTGAPVSADFIDLPVLADAVDDTLKFSPHDAFDPPAYFSTDIDLGDILSDLSYSIHPIHPHTAADSDDTSDDDYHPKLSLTLSQLLYMLISMSSTIIEKMQSFNDQVSIIIHLCSTLLTFSQTHQDMITPTPIPFIGNQQSPLTDNTNQVDIESSTLIHSIIPSLKLYAFYKTNLIITRQANLFKYSSHSSGVRNQYPLSRNTMLPSLTYASHNNFITNPSSLSRSFKRLSQLGANLNTLVTNQFNPILTSSFPDPSNPAHIAKRQKAYPVYFHLLTDCSRTYAHTPAMCEFLIHAHPTLTTATICSIVEFIDQLIKEVIIRDSAFTIYTLRYLQYLIFEFAAFARASVPPGFDKVVQIRAKIEMDAAHNNASSTASKSLPVPSTTSTPSSLATCGLVDFRILSLVKKYLPSLSARSLASLHTPLVTDYLALLLQQPLVRQPQNEVYLEMFHLLYNFQHSVAAHNAYIAHHFPLSLTRAHSPPPINEAGQFNISHALATINPSYLDILLTSNRYTLADLVRFKKFLSLMLSKHLGPVTIPQSFINHYLNHHPKLLEEGCRAYQPATSDPTVPSYSYHQYSPTSASGFTSTALSQQLISLLTYQWTRLLLTTVTFTNLPDDLASQLSNSITFYSTCDAHQTSRQAYLSNPPQKPPEYVPIIPTPTSPSPRSSTVVPLSSVYTALMTHHREPTRCAKFQSLIQAFMYYPHPSFHETFFNTPKGLTVLDLIEAYCLNPNFDPMLITSPDPFTSLVQIIALPVEVPSDRATAKHSDSDHFHHAQVYTRPFTPINYGVDVTILEFLINLHRYEPKASMMIYTGLNTLKNVPSYSAFVDGEVNRAATGMEADNHVNYQQHLRQLTKSTRTLPVNNAENGQYSYDFLVTTLSELSLLDIFLIKLLPDFPDLVEFRMTQHHHKTAQLSSHDAYYLYRSQSRFYNEESGNFVLRPNGSFSSYTSSYESRREDPVPSPHPHIPPFSYQPLSPITPPRFSVAKLVYYIDHIYPARFISHDFFASKLARLGVFPPLTTPPSQIAPESMLSTAWPEADIWISIQHFLHTSLHGGMLQTPQNQTRNTEIEERTRRLDVLRQKLVVETGLPFTDATGVLRYGHRVSANTPPVTTTQRISLYSTVPENAPSSAVSPLTTQKCLDDIDFALFRTDSRSQSHSNHFSETSGLYWYLVYHFHPLSYHHTSPMHPSTISAYQPSHFCLPSHQESPLPFLPQHKLRLLHFDLHQQTSRLPQITSSAQALDLKLLSVGLAGLTPPLNIEPVSQLSLYGELSPSANFFTHRVTEQSLLTALLLNHWPESILISMFFKLPIHTHLTHRDRYGYTLYDYVNYTNASESYPQFCALFYLCAARYCEYYKATVVQLQLSQQPINPVTYPMSQFPQTLPVATRAIEFVIALLRSSCPYIYESGGFQHVLPADHSNVMPATKVKQVTVFDTSLKMVQARENEPYAKHYLSQTDFHRRFPRLTQFDIFNIIFAIAPAQFSISSSTSQIMSVARMVSTRFQSYITPLFEHRTLHVLRDMVSHVWSVLTTLITNAPISIPPLSKTLTDSFSGLKQDLTFVITQLETIHAISESQHYRSFQAALNSLHHFTLDNTRAFRSIADLCNVLHPPTLTPQVLQPDRNLPPTTYLIPPRIDKTAFANALVSILRFFRTNIILNFYRQIHAILPFVFQIPLHVSHVFNLSVRACTTLVGHFRYFPALHKIAQHDVMSMFKQFTLQFHQCYTTTRPNPPTPQPNVSFECGQKRLDFGAIRAKFSFNLLVSQVYSLIGIRISALARNRPINSLQPLHPALTRFRPTLRLQLHSTTTHQAVEPTDIIFGSSAHAIPHSSPRTHPPGDAGKAFDPSPQHIGNSHLPTSRETDFKARDVEETQSQLPSPTRPRARSASMILTNIDANPGFSSFEDL